MKTIMAESKNVQNKTIAHLLLIIAVGIFLWVSAPAYSQTESTDAAALTLKAKQAFTAKNYRVALGYFTQANEFSPTFTLKYNMAVCHYKLGNWHEAYGMFRVLHAQEPDNELVRMNLALAANRVQKTQEATTHFRALAETAESDTIAALAYKHYLQQPSTDDTAELESLETSRWMLSADIAYGTDDNIITVADDGATSESDTFIEYTFSAAWYSNADFDNSWFLDTANYSSQYSDASEYDTDVMVAGIQKYFTTGDRQRFNFGVSMDQSSIGGVGYLQSIYYKLGMRRKLDELSSLRLSVRLQDADNRSEIYSGVAGDSTRFSMDYRKRSGSSLWRLRYRFDQDDKNDSLQTGTNGTTFTSYSANRHGYYGSWSYTKGNWNTELFYEYRNSQYQDPHLFSDNTGGLREDDRFYYGVQIERQLSDHWSLSLDISKTDNRSTLDRYDYNQTLILVNFSLHN